MTRFFTPALSLLCAGAFLGLSACADRTTDPVTPSTTPGVTDPGMTDPGMTDPGVGTVPAPGQTPAGSGALDGTTGGTMGTGAPMDTLGMGGTGTMGTGGTGTMGTGGTGTNPIP